MNTIKTSSDAIFYVHIISFKYNVKKVNESSSSHSLPSFEHRNDGGPLSIKKKNEEENPLNVSELRRCKRPKVEKILVKIPMMEFS